VSNEAEVLRWRADVHSERRAFAFLPDGRTERECATYGELDAMAVRVAAALAHCGASTGDRVLLLLPGGLDFLASFFGCLYAGVAAVTAPPLTGRRALPRLTAILRDCAPRVVLGTAKMREHIMRRADESSWPAGSSWLAVDEALEAPVDGWKPPQLREDTVALIQYTSGSTSDPKGVVLTHRNLFRNSEMIRRAMGHSESSTFVSWLPEYHDMGLIGNLLQPLHVGANCVLFPADAFLREPIVWLEAITKYRAHTSGAPDFAYAYCVERIPEEERGGLDLGSWKVAYNGSEPVRPRTLRAFSDAFADHGFCANAFYPTYGLAEATLMVTGGTKDGAPFILRAAAGALADGKVVKEISAPDHPVELVGCGKALDGETVVIVDPERRTVVAPGRVGEIWVQGDNVAAGYWNRPRETSETFGATLSGDDARRFLRTGDCGFLEAGELFVTGRLKDLMVFRGRNYHPADLEAVIDQCHPMFSSGGAAAFSIQGTDEERLVILIEARASRVRVEGQRALEDVVATVVGEFGISPDEVLLVDRGAIPRTTSGKRQRHLCRERYQSGSLNVLGRWRRASAGAAPPVDVPSDVGCQDWLVAYVAGICRLDPLDVDPSKPFASYGVDSMQAITLQHAVEGAFGLRVAPSFFLRGHSIAAAAELLLREGRPLAGSHPRASNHADGRGVMSWGQKAIWFEQQFDLSSPSYNVFFAVRVLSGITLSSLAEAVSVVSERHANLRTVFSSDDDGPFAREVPDARPRIDVVDCGQKDEAELRTLVSQAAHQPFDLTKGPLFRVTWFTRDGNMPVILVSAHHIVADLWSMVQLTSEIVDHCVRQNAGAADVELASRSSYRDFVAYEETVTAGPAGERMWAFWRRRVPEPEDRLELGSVVPPEKRRRRDGAAHALEIAPPAAVALRSTARAAGLSCPSLLLSAFAVMLARRAQARRVVLGTLATGRPREFAKTVGHFVNPLVLNLDLSDDPTSAQLFARVQREVLDIIDHQEFPFALLVKKARPPRQVERAPLFQTMFVYQHLPFHEQLAPCVLGHAQREFSLHGARLESFPIATRTCRYDLTLYMADAGPSLEGSIVYDRNIFGVATVARMADEFLELAVAMAEYPERRIFELIASENHAMSASESRSA
jgi:acyl-CoA synthetase (AMP-forming)/AMP-acid ligase II